MNIASSSAPAPGASQAGIDAPGLSEKVSIRNLEFFYGDSRALKGILIAVESYTVDDP